MVTLAYTQQADGDFMTEQEVWPWLLAHFTDQLFDAAFKKDRGVFGVAGSAYAPGNQPITAMAVRAQVGALQKTLHVHGDRRWEKSIGWQISAAQAFTSMPLTLKRAFGGDGCPENPHGKGWFSGDEPDQGQPLPNVELPDEPLLTPTDRPEVATFSMLPAGSPSRMRWVGQVDAAWQRERFPWLPDDTDPRWFDGVPSDQGQNAYWQGTETWSVQGMHPELAHVSGVLPGLRPRLLVRQQSVNDDAISVSEAHLDLDTVWLFPNEQRVMVMYRASIPVTCEDATDIVALGVFTETRDTTPLTLLEWQERWTEQEQKERGPATSTVAVPVGTAAASLSQSDDAAAAQQQAKNAQWLDDLTSDIQNSLDEGAHEANVAIAKVVEDTRSVADLDLPKITAPRITAFPPLQTTKVNWDTFETDLNADIEAALQEGRTQMQTTVREAAQHAGLDPDELMDHVRAVQDAPDTTHDKGIVEEVASIADMPEDIRQHILDKAQSLQDSLDTMDAEFGDLDPSFSALLAPGHIAETESQTLNRDQVLERLAAGTSLSGAILTDLDLSAVVFEGADLSQAVVTNCNFTGADLSAAVLDQARLVGCNLTQANLAGASLDRIDIEDTALFQADCKGVHLTRASVASCDLSRSNWTDATLDGSKIGESVLDDAVFIQATMRAINLWEVRGQRVDFRRAQLAGLRIDSDTDLSQANFEQADLQGCSLQDSNLSGAVFNEAMLDGAFIKNCILDQSVGWRASAKAADFKGSSWQGARWLAANFMTASFDSTRLENVDFSGTNLHAADVRTAYVKGLQLQGALLTRCDVLQQHALADRGVRT